MPHIYIGLGPCQSVSISPATPSPLSSAGEPLSAASIQQRTAQALASLERAAMDASNLLILSQTNPGIFDEYIRRMTR